MFDVHALKSKDLDGLSKGAMAELTAALLAKLAAQGC